MVALYFFFFSSRRRHTRWTGDWSSDVCSSDLWWIPRRWLIHGIDRYLDDVPWVPDYQLRLYRNDPAVLRFSDEFHRRSEERRVGKECRSRRSRHHQKKKNRRTKSASVAKRAAE